MRTLLVCALTLIGPLSGAAFARQDEPLTTNTPAELVMLHLYDGSTLWGSIVGHDAEALHFLRLDNGGKVRLPWRELDKDMALGLLEKYGYVDHSSDEVMMEADKLILNDGTTLVGLITARTDDALWLKTSTSTFPVPKLKLKEAALRVQVPALDVYTREELYQMESARLVPNSAQALWDLAVYCERIYDFTHAVERYQELQQFDAQFKPSEVQTAITRNQIKVKQQAQLDALREIDVLRVRGRFDDALAAIEAFVTKFEGSPLVQDARKKKGQVEKSREERLRDVVVDKWHSMLSRMVQGKARDPQLTLEAAIAWTDEGLGQALAEAVTAEIQHKVSASATPDLVRRYWKERTGGRWRQASYGQATFLLGESEARKGLEKEDPNAKKPDSEVDTARKQLAERIDRYLKQQEMVRRTQGKDQDEENELEKFWQEYPAFSKAQWMIAYYVEHSGEFQLDKVLFTNCPDCNGLGTREILNAMGRLNSGNQQGGAGQGASGGQTSLVDCPTCHSVGVLRRVRFR